MKPVGTHDNDGLNCDALVQEPRLVKLLVGLLQAHGEWYRLQRCKDRFVGPLGIDALHSLEPSEAGAPFTS